jgi:outer membrane receptor protein involved in Fe transport
VGYPWLETTNIKNYDVRAEWFHSPGEVLAVSLFKKDFYHPIERAMFDLSDKRYRTYQNTDKASSWGIEFDSRTGLDFIPTNYGKSMFLFNFTWTQSEVTPYDSITIFTGQTIANQGNLAKRPLQGQSDFIVNASITYTDLKGFNAALSYNAFSKRLVSLGISPLPDEYELPFHSMNFTASRTINKFKLSVKLKNILNSKVIFGQKDPESGAFLKTTEYKPGKTFSVGLSYDIY